MPPPSIFGKRARLIIAPVAPAMGAEYEMPAGNSHPDAFVPAMAVTPTMVVAIIMMPPMIPITNVL